MTKIERTARYYDSIAKLGFSYSEAQSLRRIEMTLHRWGEMECGDSNDHYSWSVERDETTNKPFKVIYSHTGDPKGKRYPMADREQGALNRLAKIMEKHPELWSYHQTDPRGCSLYIGRKSDLQPGDKLDSVYTRGVAVCI